VKGEIVLKDEGKKEYQTPEINEYGKLKDVAGGFGSSDQ